MFAMKAPLISVVPKAKLSEFPSYGNIYLQNEGSPIAM